MLVAALLSLAVYFVAPFASAAGLIPCVGGDACRACDLVTLIQNVMTFLVYLSPMIAVIALVVAGFKMVVGQGDGGLLKEVGANIAGGIIIMLCAWLVVDTGLKMLIKDPNFGPWNTVQCVANPKPQIYTGGSGGSDDPNNQLPQVPYRNGDCSVDALSSTWGSGAARMSCIIAGESGCRNTVTENGSTVPLGSGSDKLDGTNDSFSFGMYQINITANAIRCNDGKRLNCPSAFNNPPICATNPQGRRECLGYGSTIRDRALYNECAAAASDPNCNVPTAQDIHKRQGYSAWGADRAGSCSRYGG